MSLVGLLLWAVVQLWAFLDLYLKHIMQDTDDFLMKINNLYRSQKVSLLQQMLKEYTLAFLKKIVSIP